MSSQTWACAACTFENSGALSECSICGRARPSSPAPRSPPTLQRSGSITVEDSFSAWSCSHCRFQNRPDRSRCEACGLLRQLRSGGGKDPDDGKKGGAEWRCERCTFDNDKNKAQCGMCGLARAAVSASAPPPTAPAKTGRACPSCTYQNARSARRCVVCSRELQSPGGAGGDGKAQGGDRKGPRKGLKYSFVDKEPVLLVGLKGAQAELNGQRGRVQVTRGGAPTGDADAMFTVRLLLPRNRTVHVHGDNIFPDPETAGGVRQGGSSSAVSGAPSSSSGGGAAPTAVTGWYQTRPWSLKATSQSDAMRRQWEELMSVCAIQKQPFVDTDFIPGDKSLGSRKRGLPWRRAPSIQSRHGRGQWCVVAPPLRPGDIQQGGLGDCWFLSALAVLAERPQLLDDLIITKYFNKVGAYQVMLCRNGRWEAVLIDDHFPVTQYNTLAFSRCARARQLWVPLIEKAYAKVHGSYSAIHGGQVHEALADLTGAPCELLRLDAANIDSDLLFARLVSFRKSGFLMGASCGGTPAESAMYKRVGLQANHAYSVLDVVVTRGFKLIKLRNPWGSFEWKGAWSDESKEWRTNPEMKRELNFDDANDGVFWMTFHDLLLYFRRVDVCKLRPDWSQLRLDGQWCPRSLPFAPNRMVEICVSRSTWLTVSLIQRKLRGEEKQDYRDMGLLVLQTSASAPNRISDHRVVGCALPRKEHAVHCEFNATDRSARYFVLPLSMAADDGRRGEHANFVLSVYSSHPVLARHRPYDARLLRSALQLSIASNERSTKALGRHARISSIGTKGASSSDFIMVSNHHPSLPFEIELTITRAKNLRSSRRGVFRVVAVLPPMHRQILMVLTQASSEHGYFYSTTYTYRLRNAGTRSTNVPELLPDHLELHSPAPI